jgi:hypothetical protein
MRVVASIFWGTVLSLSTLLAAAQPNAPQYVQMQQEMARGWNTWNTRSVTSLVLLPQGLSINLGIKHNAIYQESWLPEILIGRQGADAEQVFPGIHTSVPHNPGGRYTDLSIRWRGHEMRVQSATEQNDLVLLVTPLKSKADLDSTIVFRSACSGIVRAWYKSPRIALPHRFRRGP